MTDLSRQRPGARAVAAGLGLGLAASMLSVAGAAPAHAADPVEVQVLGINDFHGRILPNFGSRNREGGAAVLAGAVDQLEAAHPNTVFAAAGDLIGASTFESFIAKDKPTIDALNMAGLDVSAAGNHEFDGGYDDLVNRVLAPFDATTNPYGGAQWEYIAANVKMRDSGDPALDPSFVQSFGAAENAVEVGFIGAVTEDLPTLVAPAGIAEIQVTDIVEAVNAEADVLAAEGVDVIVMLVHEGARSNTLAAATDSATSFGQIVNGVNGEIDAIISGHTHQLYNHAVTVPEWVAEGRTVTTRPVVSAGQYGMNLNQLLFDVDPATGDVVSTTQNVLPLVVDGAGAYPADAEVADMVAAAKAEAEVLGAEVLGQVEAPFRRASRWNVDEDGATVPDENRGGESTLGNLVAEAQRWATRAENLGAAQIAFMNPGGLRDDMVGLAENGYPADLTYRQAANVQPFANTLVNMDLTGAQIKSLLEQQWNGDAILRLGSSRGFEYTYDPTAEEDDRVTGMWLNGTPIVAGQVYSVTVNSFLASGGDGFSVLAEGANPADTGQIDLAAMVDYMAAHSPLAVDYAQHSVGVTFPADAPASYHPGSTVALSLSSLAMTGAGDVQDETVQVVFDGDVIGTAPVDNTVGFDEADEYGTAEINVRLPRYVGDPDSITVVGSTTGTRLDLPIQTRTMPKARPRVRIDRAPKKVVVGKTRLRLKVGVTSAGEPASGTVVVVAAGKKYRATLNDNGRARVKLRAFERVGKTRAAVKYRGDELTEARTRNVTVKVVQPKTRNQSGNRR